MSGQNAPKWVSVVLGFSVLCGNILAKTPCGTGKVNFDRKKYFDVLEKKTSKAVDWMCGVKAVCFLPKLHQTGTGGRSSASRVRQSAKEKAALRRP
ncbi:hypothetical protein HGO37_00150 [Rhizobium sp. CG4]|uniref:hypothetical protein n=1 Tax=Rhizobium sp. CG4 TaxID=2726075 RepID=UPI002033B32A|nr:hypothetical protein [Rhizobium sp. CG4]MCM2453787.1 hypothetical protein [Rhizobium sp. CG4]